MSWDTFQQHHESKLEFSGNHPATLTDHLAAISGSNLAPREITAVVGAVFVIQTKLKHLLSLGRCAGSILGHCANI